MKYLQNKPFCIYGLPSCSCTGSWGSAEKFWSKGNNSGKRELSQAAWQLASFPERGKESEEWGNPRGVMQPRTAA